MIERIFSGLFLSARDGFLMLLPLFILFLIFQKFFLKQPRSQVYRIIAGFAWTFTGLTIFLHGVNIGFIVAGENIGERLASSPYKWALVPMGIILGFVVTLAEPAVRILNMEIEKVTAGSINRIILYCFLATGVSLAVGLSMFRIIIGIPLWYFLVPIIIIALLLIRFIPAEFSAIAFDSGGVVTGPMIATFIVALTLSVSETLYTHGALVDGFGAIALIATVSIIAIQILGVIYHYKLRKSSDK